MATWEITLKVRFSKVIKIMPKCMMFKHGITINPRGKVRPCCSFQNKNLVDYTIDQKELWRKQFDDFYESSLDNWLPECLECMENEQRGFESLRTQANRRYDNNYTYGLKYWDLKISNTCNLMCRMCSPGDSSIWHTTLKNNPQFDWHETPTSSKNSWHDTDLPFVKEQLYDAELIKFTGGEPMLVKHVKQVIDYLIEIGVSENVELLMTTNATVPFVDYWQDLITKFKRITITCSIDAVGSRYEYIRAGANWDQVNNNVQHMLNLSHKHDNFHVNVYTTSTVLNASNRDAINNWVDSINIPHTYSIEVVHPYFMSYSSLNENLRTRFGVNSRYDFNPEHLEMLKKQMNYIDHIYGTDFETECPEFFKDNN